MKVEIVFKSPGVKKAPKTVEFSDYKQALLYITYNSPMTVVAIRITND